MSGLQAKADPATGTVLVSFVKPDGKRITARLTGEQAIDFVQQLGGATFDADPEAVSILLRRISLSVLDLEDSLVAMLRRGRPG